MIRRLALLGAVALLASPAWATVITVENTPHAASNVIPFGDGDGRYEQVYAASLFTNPVLITSLAFSPMATGTYQANVAIRLTTTTVAVGALSATLDDNVTTPLTTVFADSAFSQPVIGGSETFGLLFDFTASPFIYDPAAGNLLLDVMIADASRFTFSRSGAGPFFSRAYDTTGYHGTDLVGLRTQIGFEETVPEPTTLFLLGGGLFGLSWRRRRRG